MCRHAWQRPRHASQRPRHMEAWWYTTPLTSQFIRQQVRGFFFDVGLLGPCEKACRGRRGRCQACLERCKKCLGRCEACREWPRTLPSMPRSCQASLHILNSHNIYYIIILDQPWKFILDMNINSWYNYFNNQLILNCQYNETIKKFRWE